MMSPRSSGRYGSSFSYHAPRPPKMNLLTSKWSPTSSVPSIDADGILNACTIKVVPNRARITVTSRDSMYSENVASSPCRAAFVARSSGAASWVMVSSGIASASHSGLLQPFQRRTGSTLLSFLLCTSLPRSHAGAFHPDFHLKSLLVVGAAFRSKSILRGGFPATLQKLLQCGFAVSLKQVPATLLQRGFE